MQLASTFNTLKQKKFDITRKYRISSFRNYNFFDSNSSNKKVRVIQTQVPFAMEVFFVTYCMSFILFRKTIAEIQNFKVLKVITSAKYTVCATKNASLTITFLLLEFESKK